MKRLIITLFTALLIAAPIMAETGVSVAVPFQFAKSPTLFYEGGFYQTIKTFSWGAVYGLGNGYWGQAAIGPDRQWGASGNVVVVFERSPYQTLAFALLGGSGYNWDNLPTDAETYVKNAVGAGLQIKPYPEWRLALFGRMINGFERSPAFDIKLVFMAGLF